MSLWLRIVNVFRGDRLSQDVRLVACLDSLRADAIFGWRQIVKRKVTSAAAILSLALAVGACASAFRLIDALLLRPLPIAEPGRLYELSRNQIGFDGTPQTFDGWAYPAFVRMRAAVKERADLIAISYGERLDLTWGTGEEIEKAHVQYVSGWMFGAFGLRPVMGRLLTERDDLHPGAHPVAVLSYDYWTRRFGQDRHAIGRTFQMGERLFEVVGVAEEKFTGTEPGTMTDIFLPTMMNGEVTRSDSTWHRTLVRLKPGVSTVAVNRIRERLNATSLAFESDRALRFTGMPKVRRDNYLKQTVTMDPAPSGVSDLQHDYRRSLVALSVLVGLVLLIACANVANLMTAQAAARAREMALRVSIGAGRWRLVQLVLVESAWLSSLAAALGGLFAWWSAPLVAGMINPRDNPARLVLPMDWRLWGFGLGLIVVVTALFGLMPALRASAVKPASALKGGEDPHSRRRVMHALIAVQAAFCFLVLFVGALFVTTFERLSNQPVGFSSERLLTLDTVAHPARPPVFWGQMEDRLRAVPGVEKVGLARWPLLTGTASNGFISTSGDVPNDVLAFFLQVSAEWRDTMKIPLLAGRDFRADETGVAIVNETFARQYFEGGNPVGKFFARTGGRERFEIVGLARDARYRNIRETTLPVAYVPFPVTGAKGLPQTLARASFLVRTSGSNALTLASALRREVQRAGFGFRVANLRTQQEINRSQTVRERLLALLALFFAMVALALAGIGLYGVLDYSVLQRRREIGIRMAIGAGAAGIARLVTWEVFSMVLAGALAGLALGMLTVRYLESLLYQVKSTDPGMLALPGLAIVAAALLAALPAVIRAVRIDPAVTLRAE